LQKLENHTEQDFKLIHLKPDATEDANSLAHRHSYFEMFIFEEEGKNHFIDFEDYKVEKRTMHLVMPGSIHLLKRNKHTKGYVLLFSEEFYHLNVKNYDLWLEIIPLLIESGCSTTLEKDDFENVINLCKQIESYKEHKLISTYLHLIILIFQKSFKAQERKFIEKKQVAFEFRKLVEIYFKKEHNSSFYANKLNIEIAVLSKNVKNAFGKSPTEILKERILLEAKRLLYHNDYTSKEIAYSLGFNDDSYFSKFFKSKAGVSTNQFRKNSRERFK